MPVQPRGPKGPDQAPPESGALPSAAELLAAVEHRDRGGATIELEAAAIAQPSHSSYRLAPFDPPFLYWLHADSYEVGVVEGEPVLLPVPALMVIQPGADGVRTLNEGEDPAAAFARAIHLRRDRGQVLVDHQAVIDAAYLPPGVAPGPYLRSFPCVHPQLGVVGRCHTDAWRVPSGRPGEPVEWQVHRGAWDAWRLSLVERGIAPPISTRARSMLRLRARDRLERAEADGRAERIVAERRARLEAVEAAIGAA